MKIKRTGENRFAAYDEAGRCVGKCSFFRRELPKVFPDCPAEYAVNLYCTDESRDLLCGAAVTRARMLAAAEKGPCRIYADLDPDDRDTAEVLHSLGFSERDGILRMHRRVSSEVITDPIPAGCTIVRDYLNSEEEQYKCLKRYNECFSAKNKADWLQELRSRPDFARILMVSPNEMCGELMVWSSGSTGVIGILQVASAWRRKGVATYLLEDARMYFAYLGLRDITFDVWLSAPGSLPLARKAGYQNGSFIALYPTLPGAV